MTSFLTYFNSYVTPMKAFTLKMLFDIFHFHSYDSIRNILTKFYTNSLIKVLLSVAWHNK